MGGRGAGSFSGKQKIKGINDQIKKLDAQIKQRLDWGRQVYNDELKMSNGILANASRKYELKINGYHVLVAERTKLKKQLDAIKRMNKH